MQVYEPGRVVTNLEAASIISAARARRSQRFPPSKDVAIREVQALFYLIKDANFTRISCGPEAVQSQAGFLARLTSAGVEPGVVPVGL